MLDAGIVTSTVEESLVPQVIRPVSAAWFWPAVLFVTGVLALVGAWLNPVHAKLWTLLPYTYIGNSLAPLPYDGAIVWLGSRAPLWQVVVIGVVGTVLVEYWNMELLRRILAREGTHGFRKHRLTRGMLLLFNRLPFLVLIGSCALPIIPHYPVRVLGVLARYPMWKYQLAVIIGRGARYIWLGLLGSLFRLSVWLLVVVSLIPLGLGWRQARRMNAEGATT